MLWGESNEAVYMTVSAVGVNGPGASLWRSGVLALSAPGSTGHRDRNGPVSGMDRALR